MHVCRNGHRCTQHEGAWKIRTWTRTPDMDADLHDFIDDHYTNNIIQPPLDEGFNENGHALLFGETTLPMQYSFSILNQYKLMKNTVS